MNTKDYIRLLRPQQWIKNFFVMLPLFFGGRLFDEQVFIAGLITFLSYSFAASSVYCFNDIHDVDDDRRHPMKCHRPVASGAIPVAVAYGLMLLCIVLSMLCLLLLPAHRLETGGVILFYWLLNLAYCPFKAVCHHRCVHCCLWFRAPFACRRPRNPCTFEQMDCAYDFPHHAFYELCQATRRRYSHGTDRRSTAEEHHSL